jgi:hypothetical protein
VSGGVAYLACVERGRLESQGVLLCESIRRFAGQFANAPIHTFQPRAGTDISDATLTRLRELNVEHHKDLLNRDLHDYPIGNKVIVSAHAEKVLDEPILVFLDSDTFFAGEPGLFDLSEEVDAAARPVDRKRIGSCGQSDPNDAYWRTLYSTFGIRDEPFVETNSDQERIRAYFNSGLVVARRSAGVLSEWLQVLKRLFGDALLPPDGSTQFLDQVSLAIVLARRFERVSQLDWRYNYPLPQRSRLIEPARSAALGDLIHLHYHRWFQKPGFLRLLRPELDFDNEVGRWLEARLPLQPVIHDRMMFRGVEA